ncbi:MAG: holo-[acyl-carrier-protein] synthase [Elusimicrobia bacterium RIFOXYA2_FULL_39_19]|nr:MAG: holo-[acyl-carrier-protein] synthase [Elusimicrobia bacterium RIFOXYA2_FULL_39_19]
MNIGIDIIEVKRIEKLIKNKRFLNKIFTPQEIAYCKNKKNFSQHYAVRFAAKEAVWKAAGEKSLAHRDISIKNTQNGKPEIIFPKKFLKLQKKISISLSHTKEFAAAVAVCL